MLDLKKIISEVTNGIKACAKQASDIGTWVYYIGRDVSYNGNTVDVALVYTYNKGFNDILKQPDDEIAIKLAHQPSNSVMQCDYDIDWQYPDCANNYTETGLPINFVLNKGVPLEQEKIDEGIAEAIKWCLGWAIEYNIIINNL